LILGLAAFGCSLLVFATTFYPLLVLLGLTILVAFVLAVRACRAIQASNGQLAGSGRAVTAMVLASAAVLFGGVLMPAT
jgi:hypothetical protein